MSWLVFLGILFAIIMSSLFVWVLILKFKEEEQPSDDLIFKNFLPQYTHGHSQGSVLEIKKGDNRSAIIFIPKDFDYVRALKKKEKVIINPELIWIENHKLLNFPKGTLSSHRNELWGLPPKAEDLNEELKNTEIGKSIMKTIEDLNMKHEESHILRNRINVQSGLLNKTEGLELVNDAFSKVMEINKDLVKVAGENKPKTQTFGMPSTSST